MLPFTYRYFPKRMNFAINPPSNKINKFSLTILSQKHAHCEPFSSLPFLLFNKYENGLESERESVQINSSGFRFNVTFVDCTSVFVKSVLETSLFFLCSFCVVRHFRLSLLNNFYRDILHLYNIVIPT